VANSQPPILPSRSAAHEQRSRLVHSIPRLLGGALFPLGCRAWDVRPTAPGTLQILLHVTQQVIRSFPLLPCQPHGIGYAVASSQRVQLFDMPHYIHNGQATVEMFFNLVNTMVSHADSFLVSFSIFSSLDTRRDLKFQTGHFQE
jgi:hypothetical protein